MNKKIQTKNNIDNLPIKICENMINFFMNCILKPHDVKIFEDSIYCEYEDDNTYLSVDIKEDIIEVFTSEITGKKDDDIYEYFKIDDYEKINDKIKKYFKID